MESDDPRAVRAHTSSFALYTVHFQFANALMTADRKPQTGTLADRKLNTAD
jgi:hypothetical protein